MPSDKKAKDSPEPAAAAPPRPPPTTKKREPRGLMLRAEGSSEAMMVYLKEHCLSERVDQLPERFESSIESIVGKMTKASTWVLLYESVTEELTFRAKLAAHALCATHVQAVAEATRGDIYLDQERVCLPNWKKSSPAQLANLSRLRATACTAQVRVQRRELLRQVALEWCEHEDLIAFLDGQLAPLEMEIDHFKGIHDGQGHAHTPHVKDAGRLMFRNSCLLHSRVFPALCLAAYSLVHELHEAERGGAEQDSLLELLEGLHMALDACNVADDHLSLSTDTREMFDEMLLQPICSAMERYSPEDIRGHPCSDRNSSRRVRC